MTEVEKSFNLNVTESRLTLSHHTWLKQTFPLCFRSLSVKNLSLRTEAVTFLHLNFLIQVGQLKKRSFIRLDYLGCIFELNFFEQSTNRKNVSPSVLAHCQVAFFCLYRTKCPNIVGKSGPLALFELDLLGVTG